MNLPKIDQILTRAIAEMAGHELETINQLEEGDVIRFPGHGIPADELAELEALLTKKPRAETTQPSKPEKKAPEGPLPRQATSDKPKTVKNAQKPGRLTSLNKGQTVMIHHGGKRKDWYLERTTAGTYVAVAGAKMQRSKTLEGALRWLWKQSQGGMQRQITKVFDLDAIKAGNTLPEEKPQKEKSTPPQEKSQQKMPFAMAKKLAEKEELETPTARLTWNEHTWTLEELPAKGKGRLRVAKLPNPLQNVRHNPDLMNYWRPINILIFSNIKETDTYEQIKSKLEKSYEIAEKHMRDEMNTGPTGPKEWQEKSIQSAKVTPAGIKPIEIRGKGFFLKSTWTKFDVILGEYTPFSRQDRMHSKTPGGARKLYKLVSENPKKFEKMGTEELWKLLRNNKIAFDYF